MRAVEVTLVPIGTTEVIKASIPLNYYRAFNDNRA